VREVGRGDEGARFAALLRHVTPGLLLRSFDGLEKDAAPGADGVTWRDYERGALPRLVALRDRVRSGRYRAVPSRRVYIPKADGRLRPPGIASLEDKVLRRAVREVLNAACGRRSQKGRVTWERMNRIASRYLPRTRTVHPWPDKRFAARYP
jgi:hypothetical protein